MLRFAVVASVVSVVLSGILLFTQPERLFNKFNRDHYFDYLFKSYTDPDEPEVKHPIEDLIAEFRELQGNILSQQSTNLASAAERYRERRGRHPPPGFDAWFAYASEHDAIIVESYFDRIYHDLAPFWALDPHVTARRAATWHHVVQVRNGNATGVGNTEGRVPWLSLWTSLVEEAAPHLPDVDMPINYMDESRLLVPWEEIDGYVTKEQSKRVVVPKAKVVSKYTGLAAMDATFNNDTVAYDPKWERADYWDLSRAACSPTTPSRDVAPLGNFEQFPTFSPNYNPDFAYQGYIHNYTAASDPCLQPHLRGMHGTFVEPVSMSTTKELIPLFGGCKIPGNNDILIPGAMYLTDDAFYSGGETHGPPWKDKINGAVWRGVASGGRNKKENWSHFQRHRLVEMLNGTTVSLAEQNVSRAPTFELPPEDKYDFPRRREGTIGEWMEGFGNAGFVNLLCFPTDSNCEYILPWFREVQGIPMSEQYKYKFMPDVDGNSFSARFRGFMLSTSLPLKATIYAEWHDDRLLPWQHFVPMDNTFQDLYAILDFFTRDKKGDDAARYIAQKGQEWAAKVLRREDMLLYVWRLLLEFARVCDERREVLGFVDDLS
ncbi:capsule associated protein [Xylariales sp. PMI_506]|nr:capsule associated protein [Xylariales sp. PMI_506]